MYRQKERRFTAVFFAVLMAFFVFASAGRVYAADAYYGTWADYQASGQPASSWNDVANAMDAVFDYGIELFSQGDYDGAYNCVNDGYYGYYETTGFERIAMGYISGSRKTEVELQFSSCKSVCKNQGSQEEFETEIAALKDMIHSDANVLDGTSDDSSSDSASSDSSTSDGSASNAAAVAAFSASFSIMLREGFEAILIVGAIIAYLTKQEQDPTRKKKKVYPVYLGSVIGIAASFGLAALLNAIKLANTASQEIIEGVTALLAVVVLYYVSNWMLSKSESDAWNNYIKSKAERSSERGSLFALAFTAFLAVFREGAEVVLFFQPMLAGDHTDMVWTGFVVGCIVLVFVYLAIRLLSIRIPIKPFFTATSILMFIMSISFLGAGIKELIEGDVITMVSPGWLQWIPTNDVLDVLGIYPTLQTLVPQLILLVITVVIFVRTTKKNNLIHAEAEAKREAERLEREAKEKQEAEAALEKKITEIVNRVLDERAKK